VRRLLKPYKPKPSSRAKNEVVKMASWINREPRSKKREKKEKSPFITRGLFGVIKNTHGKPSHSRLTTAFSGYQTAKTFEEYRREFELQKSKALAHFISQTRLI